MGTQMLRVATSDLSRICGQPGKLQFVLKNQVVFTGLLVTVNSSSLKIKNTTGRILHLPLAQIEEIWADIKANAHQ